MFLPFIVLIAVGASFPLARGGSVSAATSTSTFHIHPEEASANVLRDTFENDKIAGSERIRGRALSQEMNIPIGLQGLIGAAAQQVVCSPK